MKQEEKIGLWLVGSIENSLDLTTDFREQSPEEFTEKHPKVAVCDFTRRLYNHPVYNRHIVDQERLEQYIKEGFTIYQIGDNCQLIDKEKEL
jgi:hypothetical protein